MFGQLGCLSIPGAVSSGGSSDADINMWIRPSDWPAMPTSAANQIDILVAVFNDGSNFCALSATVVGGYTVDWGDGTIENVASATQRDHQYSYSDADLGPVTSRGYKTAIIKVYPQAANAITAFDLGLKNATSGLIAYSNPWLDIQVNAPSATAMVYRGGVEARFVERVNIVAIGAITTLASVFLNCSNLQSIFFPINSLTSVTSLSSAFSLCYSLKYLTFPSGSLTIVNTFANAFLNSNSIKIISFPSGSLTLLTSLASAFSGCVSLQYVYFPDGSLTLVTTLSGAFTGCTSLENIRFPPGGLGIVSITTTAFSNCSNLRRIINCTIPVSFTLPCLLGPVELDEIYTSLPTIVAQTITVTGNWGTVSDNPAIATGKGWTVTGS